MLADLKFVQGAVSKKDYVPAMAHFQLQDGRIKSYNGFLTICSPIECDLTCNPKAETLVKAISKCESENLLLTLTPKGKLSIKSGNYKVLIECLPEVVPEMEPEGTFHKIDGEELYRAFQELYPIIGEDATRPWANGILLQNNAAYATNNVILARKTLSDAIPLPLNIPKAAIKELIRVKAYSNYIQVTENNVTFHYDQNKWIKTTLFDCKWPDVDSLLGVDHNCQLLPENFYKEVLKLKDFGDDFGRVYFTDSLMSTCPKDNIEDVPSFQIELDGLRANGAFQLEMISRISGIAKKMDFTLPSKAVFEGDNLLGLIMGVRA